MAGFSLTCGCAAAVVFEGRNKKPSAKREIREKEILRNDIAELLA
jgi:hypothetical protein